MEAKETIQYLKEHLRKQSSSTRHSMLNAWRYIDKADKLFDIDREMCAFCAITAEEEAATALIKLIKERQYPESSCLQPNSHPQKVAVFFVLKAFEAHLFRPGRAIHTIQVFDYDKDKLQLRGFTNFLPEGQFIVFHPLPLNLISLTPDGKPHDYKAQIDELTSKTISGKLSKHIKSEANTRNLLLYADQKGSPKSEAEQAFIRFHEKKVLIMSTLYIMIAQHKEQQPLVASFTKVLASLMQSVKNND